jgi:hypothetical protein
MNDDEYGYGTASQVASPNEFGGEEEHEEEDDEDDEEQKKMKKMKKNLLRKN